MWLLHPLRFIYRTMHLVLLAFKGRFFLKPHGENDLNSIGELLLARTRIHIPVPKGLKPSFMLSCTNSQCQATMGEDIDGTCHFSQQCGVTVAHAGSFLAKTYPSGVTCQCCG